MTPAMLSNLDASSELSLLVEERFFELSVDLLCVLGFDGYFKRLNRAWERTLGFTIAELTSRPFYEFVHPDDRARTLNQNGDVRGGGRALGFENRYVCKDGSFRWLRWNARPDHPQGLICSEARDITEERAAEVERERLVNELRAAFAEIKVLQNILPICSYCKKIRDEEDQWSTVESYISHHTNSYFSHSICPDCMRTHVDADLA